MPPYVDQDAPPAPGLPAGCVVLGAPPDDWSSLLAEALAAARAAGSSTDPAGAALDVARRLGPAIPCPAGGRTRARWEVLATLAAADLTCARVTEAHLDAFGTLQEASSAGVSVDLAAVSADGDSTWGVFAAEGAAARLDAIEGPDGGWRLRGTKPWCSLAGRLSHALVTAHTDAGRRLFVVALQQPGVRVHADAWVARGLQGVPSGPVDFDDVPVVPVGAVGWYLRRPGFAWGGIGVAACWYGGAVGVARRLWRGAVERAPDQIALAHLGGVDMALHGARTVLADAAVAVDSGAASEAPALLAGRVRAVVADAAEQVLARVGHALGPAPLALEEAHSRRIADLQLYLRQHHAERDLAALGELLLAQGEHNHSRMIAAGMSGEVAAGMSGEAAAGSDAAAGEGCPW